MKFSKTLSNRTKIVKDSNNLRDKDDDHEEDEEKDFITEVDHKNQILG